MSEAYRHPVADCERCQANIVLYGMSYMRISTDEHIDPPDLLVIVGPVNKKLYPPCSHCGSQLRPGVSTCPVCGPHAHGRPGGGRR